MTTRQPDPAPGAAPERGFVLGVFGKGVDGEEELAELRELARTAGVVPVAELDVQLLEARVVDRACHVEAGDVGRS